MKRKYAEGKTGSKYPGKDIEVLPEHEGMKFSKPQSNGIESVQ